MTRFAILTIVLMSLFCSTAQAGGAKTVWVNAYTRSDGTYVSGYWRSPPDGIGVGSVPSLGSSSYVPAGTSSYTAIQPKPAPKDTYCYDINIYRSGNRVVELSYRYQGGCGIGEDTIQLAAESSVFKAQEKLRRILYSDGLGHQQVNSIVLSAFTADACQLQEAPPDTTTSEYRIMHRYTMDCIIPVIPDPPPPPPNTKKKK